MKILITGGTGFIGSAIIDSRRDSMDDFLLLTRGEPRIELFGNVSVKYIPWDPPHRGAWERSVNDCDAVINLSGKNVFDERWNDRVKKEVLESRIITTRMIVDAIGKVEKKPKVFISASAVGYYGDRGDEVITEASSRGNDFLGEVAQQWEAEAMRAEEFGVRVAIPRIGLVLERSGGMIGKMMLPFKAFVGGPIGSGHQYLPWVHMKDVVRGLLYPVENESLRGVYNLVAPSPVTMKEFVSVFGSVLQRPAWIPVPDIALEVLYGEGAKAILAGQRAVPERLLSAGFTFDYPELRPALDAIVRS